MIYWAILLSLVGVILSYFFRESKRWKDVVNFITLVLATIVGVYIAVYFADKQSKEDREVQEKRAQDEKVERAKKFINITINNLERFGNLLNLYVHLSDSENIESYLKKNSNLLPSIAVLENPSTLELVSPETINQMGNDLTNIKSALDHLYKSELSNKDSREDIMELMKIKDFMVTALQYEIQYQNKWLTEVELYSRIDQIARDEAEFLRNNNKIKLEIDHENGQEKIKGH